MNIGNIINNMSILDSLSGVKNCDSSAQTLEPATAPKMGPKKNKTQENIKTKCVHFNRGYCRRGEDCRELHPDKVCPDVNCFNIKCPLRHPNPCKFGPRCTFQMKEMCLYSHVYDEKDESEKLDELDRKVDSVEKEKSWRSVSLLKRWRISLQ